MMSCVPRLCKDLASNYYRGLPPSTPFRLTTFRGSSRSTASSVYSDVASTGLGRKSQVIPQDRCSWDYATWQDWQIGSRVYELPACAGIRPATSSALTRLGTDSFVRKKKASYYALNSLLAFCRLGSCKS